MIRDFVIVDVSTHNWYHQVQHRFLETMRQAARNRHPISTNQAEQMVWQQLEEGPLPMVAHLEQKEVLPYKEDKELYDDNGI